MLYSNGTTKFLWVSLITGLLVFLSFLLGQMIAKNEEAPLDSVLVFNKQCQTQSDKNINQLIVHVPVEVLAKKLLPILCRNEVVSRQFGTVEVNWGGNLAEQIEYLSKGIADLILTKDNIMSALKGEETHNYKTLVSYQEYTAFFISNIEKPRLDKAYFLDKSIGLLDYPTSRSGHIAPMSAFKKLDINLDSLNISYFSSHDILREKLASGEVDIIASYWGDKDSERFSAQYKTPIVDNITGSQWYMKFSNENTELACALQRSVVELVSKRSGSYFNEVVTHRVCE